MNDELRSMLLGLSALYVVAAVALVLTIVRRAENPDRAARTRVIHLFLLGISCQCAHSIEEFVTGFYVRFPHFLGLAPWPSEFFVTFNLTWIALWVASAVGVWHNLQPAYFAVWFFALGMMVNGVAHPLLAVATQGYFPGLITSPIVGIIGFVLAPRLWQLASIRQKFPA